MLIRSTERINTHPSISTRLNGVETYVIWTLSCQRESTVLIRSNWTNQHHWFVRPHRGVSVRTVLIRSNRTNQHRGFGRPHREAWAYERCWFAQTERIITVDSFDPTEAWAYERCWFVRTERINAVGSFRLNQGAHTLYLPFEGGDAGRRHECQWTRVITGGRGNTAPEHPVIIGRAYVLPHRHHRAPNIYHSSFPQPGSQVFCDTLVDVLSSTFIHHHERRIILPVHCDGASTSSSVGAVYRRVVSFRTT